MSDRLVWRREPAEKGLARIVQYRGYQLRFKGETVAVASALFDGFSRNIRGYYYYARNDDPNYLVLWKNTVSQKPPYESMEEAKAAALAYVKQCLGRK